MKYTSINYVKKLFEKKGFSPLKQFGQNFLIDENIVQNICKTAEIDDKNIIEIGPGLGALTGCAKTRVKKLVAIEIDNGFYAHLCEQFSDAPNIKIVHSDVLALDIPALVKEEFNSQPFTLMANLPYYITTACILKFLHANIPIRKMVVMMQKEVAIRICAEPGEKGYGSLSVIIAYFGTANIEINVSKHCFFPKPDVDSCVISIDIKELNHENADVFITFVRNCFKMKRKTLNNNLKACGYTPEKILKAFSTLQLSSNIRAEQMDLSNFLSLLTALKE